MIKDLEGKHGLHGRYTMFWQLTLPQIGEQDYVPENNPYMIEIEDAPVIATSAAMNARTQGMPPSFENQTTGTPIRTCAHEGQLHYTGDVQHQGMTVFNVGTSTTMMNQMYRSRNHLQDRYLVRLPGLLQGVKCYTDVSTSPDSPSLSFLARGAEQIDWVAHHPCHEPGQLI
jgi:hypothetical protein